MAYELGIDLGTTYTAAAIRRTSAGRRAAAEALELGTRSAVVASVLFLAQDGSVLVGEAAERRALTDPARVAREFKRRIGDDTPMIVGGLPWPAHQLAAQLVRWVTGRAAQQEGGPASMIALAHPASWGPHKTALLGGALAAAGLPHITFLAEPQAAAVNYALAERVEPGSTIAVYDLGGGTFDAAIVRKTERGGFELLGRPAGIERLGGIDFDEAVFSHVRAGLGDAVEALDTSDPDVVTAVSRLRRECVEAKEALSADTEVTIPVLLPDLRTQIRLHRAEFEDLIRPSIEDTVDALRGAVASAGVRSADLTAVLLVGGSSRIPLVAQLVSEGLRRPVAVDADPKLAIALGAVCALSPPSLSAPPPPAEAGAAHQEPAPAVSAVSQTSAPAGRPPPPRPEVVVGPGPGQGAGTGGGGRRHIRPILVISAVGLALAAALVGFFATRQVEPTSGPPESPAVTPTFVAPAEGPQLTRAGPVPQQRQQQPQQPARPTRDRTGPTRTTTTTTTSQPVVVVESPPRPPTGVTSQPPVDETPQPPGGGSSLVPADGN